MGFRTLHEFLPGDKCQFCVSSLINEHSLGPIYKLRNITLHYFCLLLASEIEQKGTDKQGVLGFFARDIRKEIERGSKIVCNYCHRYGATVKCGYSLCKKKFHLPCGQVRGSIHQFFKEFKSYCPMHRPQQKIPKQLKRASKIVTCILCSERVKVTKNTYKYIWPSCCKALSLFHRDCIQRMACSAGYYHFRCPLCNNTREFQEIMFEYGIYIPEREASWEREPNAYSDLLERYNTCDAENCLCDRGRDYGRRSSEWQIQLCSVCGGSGIHLKCSGIWNPSQRNYSIEWKCPTCVSVFGKKNKEEQNRNNASSTIEGTEQNSGVINSLHPTSSNMQNNSLVPELIVLSDSEDEIVEVEFLSSDEDIIPARNEIVEEEIVNCSPKQRNIKRQINHHCQSPKRSRYLECTNSEQSSTRTESPKCNKIKEIMRKNHENKDNQNEIQSEDDDCYIIWPSLKYPSMESNTTSYEDVMLDNNNDNINETSEISDCKHGNSHINET